MKTFLLAGLLLSLSACSTDSDSTHAAVSAYIKKNIGDPESYQAVRFGRSVPLSQHVDDSIKAEALLVNWNQNAQHAQGFIDDTTAEMYRIFGDDTVAQGRAMRSAMLAANRADALQLQIDKLRKSTSHAVIGESVHHAFRAKNKMGALVLDSAQFLVYKDGKVQML